MDCSSDGESCAAVLLPRNCAHKSSTSAETTGRASISGFVREDSASAFCFFGARCFSDSSSLREKPPRLSRNYQLMKLLYNRTLAVSNLLFLSSACLCSLLWVLRSHVNSTIQIDSPVLTKTFTVIFPFVGIGDIVFVFFRHIITVVVVHFSNDQRAVAALQVQEPASTLAVSQTSVLKLISD